MADTPWDQTTEGAAFNQDYFQLQYGYQTTLPQHKASLSNLATRPIEG